MIIQNFIIATFLCKGLHPRFLGNDEVQLGI